MQAAQTLENRFKSLRSIAYGCVSGLAIAITTPTLAETTAENESVPAEPTPIVLTGNLAATERTVVSSAGAQSSQTSSTAAKTPAPAPAVPPRRPPPPSTEAKLVVSQFADIPIAGDAASTLRYSGRADAYITVRGSKWGLDDSWALNIRPEFSWGQDSNGRVGLIPGNTALFRPEGAEDYDLSLSVKKTWSSGASLEVGKMNVLDTSGALPIVGSNGHFGFQNLGIALPPTAVVPNTLTGAMLQIPTKKMIYRFWVFDPDSQYNRTGFETAFDSGVAFMAAAARRTKLGGKPGIVNFAVVGSTRSGPAVDILPTALTPPPNGNFGNEENELALQLSAYQYLALYPEAPGKGWGILARFQASSGDPTFLDYSGYIGISGNPRSRPQDRFGLAYFHYSLTDELVDDIAFRLPIEDEQGVEAFYTLGLAKGWEVTANVQVVDSAVAFRDTGVTAGIRINTTL